MTVVKSKLTGGPEATVALIVDSASFPGPRATNSWFGGMVDGFDMGC